MKLLRYRGGLRSRVVGVLAAVLVPLVVLTGLFVTSRYDAERDQARAEMTETVGQIRTRYDVWLAKTEGFLASLSTVLTVTNIDGAANCDGFRDGLATSSIAVTNVLVADTNGDIRCSMNPIPAEVPRNLAGRASFRAARDRRAFQVLTLDEGVVGQLRRLPVAYPWMDGERFRGVILAPVEPAELAKILDSVSLPPAWTATVYDRVGSVAARSGGGPSLVGTNQANQAVFRAATRPDASPSFEVEGIDGVRKLHSTTWVSVAGAGRPLLIVVGSPVSVVYRDANQVRTTTLIALTVGLAIVAGISLGGAELLVLRPVHMLQDRIERTAGGEVEALTGEIKGVRELRTLSEAFGTMTASLQERASRIETSERRLRTMAETGPAVTFLLDPVTQGFVEMSGQVEEFLGVTPEMILADPQVGFGRLSPDSLTRWGSALAECIDLETSVVVDLELCRAGDVWGWIRVHLRAARDAEGALLGVQGVTFDITDQVATKEELAQMNVVLEERVRARTAELSLLNTELARVNRGLADANEELVAFSYSVSHDLRAPLRAISGFAQLLAVDHGYRLDEEGLRLLGRVQAAAERMGMLIDDLLGLAQVGRSLLDIRPIDLTGLAHEVVDERVGDEPDRSAKVTVQDGLAVRGDPTLVRVLVDNLVENAWKFTGNEQLAVIDIGALPGPDDQGRQVFFVRDNGAGFDMTYVDKLFQPFQRLHAPQEFEGTGIGLAIVARIVARHGGRVWATSELGRGTTVFFQLAEAPSEIEVDPWL